MESLERYQSSREELLKIDKQSGAADSMFIDLSKLDSVTKERLLLAINSTVSQRIKDIDRVILGINSDYQNM